MENNQVATTQNTSFNELMIMAKTFAESGMFSETKQAAQAFVKMQAGQEIGIPPFQAMSGIHIIQGKVTIGAGVIASRVKGSGKYDYKVLEMSEKNCCLEFFQGKESLGKSEFSAEEAKKAGTKNMDKFPKNMLFARAISNGVKWYCADVFSGPVYVPEEMANITEEAQHTVIATVIDNDSELKKEYLNIISTANDNILSDDEKEKFKVNTKGVEYTEWNTATLKKAIASLTKIISDRKEQLLALEHENNINSQTN